MTLSLMYEGAVGSGLCVVGPGVVGVDGPPVGGAAGLEAVVMELS